MLGKSISDAGRVDAKLEMRFERDRDRLVGSTLLKELLDLGLDAKQMGHLDLSFWVLPTPVGEEPRSAERWRKILLIDVGSVGVDLLGEVRCNGSEGLGDDVEDLWEREGWSMVSTDRRGPYFWRSGKRRRTACKTETMTWRDSFVFVSA
jgi:hypothetical protein